MAPSPALGAGVSDAMRRELRWPALAGASYYAVFVFSDGRPVGMLRTRTTLVQATNIYASTGGPLRQGVYTWLVVGVLDGGTRWSYELAGGSFEISA